MKTDEIRERYLAFFEQRGHRRIASDSLIPQDDPTLLFTGAGMNQFKEYFLGIKKDFTRATSSQKCLRTGDLDNVGKTAYHHSFFEMLGNFSFGDYFKEEAITWAWEFMTKELRLAPERLQVSVHTEDHESYDIWHKGVGLGDALILKCGDKDNFWPANAPQDGPNGPCGPCSEIFYDQGVDVGCRRPECSPACDCGRFAEVWNLVFTQYERKDGGILAPLPSKNIDTGMGLERIACVMQGKRTNYEIDIFQPLILSMLKLVPKNKRNVAEIRPNVYAIADHIRAIVFAISDGAYPSNEGRGYVIRKLLRRAVYHAHSIGIKRAFLYDMVPLIVAAHRTSYADLKEHQPHVQEIVKSEEKRFLQTLDDGLQLLNELIDGVRNKGETVINGKDVFKLYDTYGFPDELTRQIAGEQGLTIDEAGFDREMALQQERAKQTTGISESIFVSSELDAFLSRQPKTEFCGYEQCETTSKVISFFYYNQEHKDGFKAGEKDGIVILNKTPFYAESGGQVGDSGRLTKEGAVISVKKTFKKDDVFYHVVDVEQGNIKKGDVVCARVDVERRHAIMKNHTATHLLQAALRQVLGTHVRQLGSLVSDEKLRFDFSYPKALTQKQKQAIERIVNDNIHSGIAVGATETSLEDAKQKGALAFFGDRYGTAVRMVSVGGVSKELCGGTHLHNTSEIGVFTIMSESSVASGIRRIEACTGERAQQFVQTKKLVQQKDKDRQAEKEREAAARRARVAEVKQGPIIETIVRAAKKVKDCTLLTYVFKGLDQGGLREVYDVLKTKVERGIIVLFSEDSGQLSILVALTKDLDATAVSADAIVKQLVNEIGGSGGGKKRMAFAGAATIDNIDTIITVLPEIIAREIKNK